MNQQSLFMVEPQSISNGRLVVMWIPDGRTLVEFRKPHGAETVWLELAREDQKWLQENVVNKGVA